MKAKVDSQGFTMPASDIELMLKIKNRCLSMGMDSTKSEIVRAGIHTLNNMPDEKLKTVMASIPRVKAGRPKQKQVKS